MKRWTMTALAFLAAILATPSLCHAHALHPAYYPLGPYAFILSLAAPAAFLPVVLVVGIQTAILRCVVSSKKAFGILWRTGIVFLASKAGESIPGCVILWTAPWVMWSPDSPWATVWAPLLLFGVGVVVNAALVRILFREQRPGKVRILFAAGLLSVTSYVVLLLSTIGMLHVGWME